MALIAHYKLNDNAADTVVADASGNGFVGVAARNTNLTTIAGKVGTAYNANGTTDQIDIANPGSILDGCYATICAWVYRNGASGPRTPRIIDRVYNGQFACYINESYNCMGFAGKGSLGTTDTATRRQNSVPVGQWLHLTWVIAAGGISSYINGAYNAGIAAIGTLYASASAMRIAQRVDGSSRTFKGYIDDLRIYNEVLTLAQIQAIYNGGNGTELPYPWLAAATKAHHYRMRRAG